MIINLIKRYLFTLSCSLCIVVLSLAPIGAPEVASDVPFFDKWAHFVMYGALTVIIWSELYRSNGKQTKTSVLLVSGVLFPAVLGGLMELAQATLTTYRSGEWLDALANTTGVGIGALLSWAVVRYRSSRV